MRLFLKYYLIAISFLFSIGVKAGDGSSPFNAFNTLAEAQSVNTPGSYWFDFGGFAFETYVDGNGYVEVAFDYGNGVGELPGIPSLDNTTRGILLPMILAGIPDAAEIRISHSGGLLDVTTTDATLIDKLKNNVSLNTGVVDVAFNTGWVGVGAGTMNRASGKTACNDGAPLALPENIFWPCGDSEGFHWKSNGNFQRLVYSSGDIGNTESFTLWVRASLLVGCANDSDGDGVCDDVDLDKDNDGILDVNECMTSNFQWSSPPQVNGKTATGTINGINYTYTSSINIETTPGIFSYSTFPASFNIPNTTVIKNRFISNNKITFAQPVLNPTLIFSSIGGGNSVPVQFSNPVDVLFQSGPVTIDSPTQLTAKEGYVILRMNGTYSEISFDYLANENYVNFTFGADFATFCDTDNDGTPDYLDTDSDADGCLDAIEGGAGFKLLDINNDALFGAVDAKGVPISANNGQNVGSSADGNIKSNDCACDDNDNDGVCDDLDLDDDNDGILDTEECSNTFVSKAFQTNGGATTTFLAPSADGGFRFDVFKLDNSFNLNVNGFDVVASQIQCSGGGAVGESLLVFSSDNTGFGQAGNDNVWVINGDINEPVVRLIIGPNGEVSFQGKRNSGRGLEAMEILGSDPQPVNITWNSSGNNVVILSQMVVGPTNISGEGYGLLLCAADTDGDGILNYLDTDSDGDGCLDAIEGGAGFEISDLNGLVLNGAVDANGVPISANGGQNIGSSADVNTLDANCIIPVVVDTFYVCEGASVNITKTVSGITEWSGSETFTTINESTITASPTKSTTYYIRTFTKKQDILINGGFENNSGTGIRNASELIGWNTTASDNKVEIWANGFIGHASYSGNFLVELNANEKSALYQDVATTPGEKLAWGFAHKARGGGIETVEFEVGPPGGPYQIIETAKDLSATWGYYEGIYEIPAGQNITRFYFSSTDPGGAGNLMDGIAFNRVEEEKDSVVVIVYNNDNLSLGNDTTICSGASLTLDAGIAQSYLWSTTATAQTIDVTTTGAYSVEVTNTKGCKSNTSINVTVNPCITDHFNKDTLYFCKGDSILVEAKDITTQVWGGEEGFTQVNNSTIKVSPNNDAYYFVGTAGGTTIGQNLIVNGDFESGNTGFTTAYQEQCTRNQPPGKFCINNSPKNVHSGFTACGDHTSGTGKMYIANGASVAGQKVWCQTVATEANKDYEFSAWITSVVAQNPPRFEFEVNGVSIGNLNAQIGSCLWDQHAATWNSGIAVSAEICLTNQNTVGAGNDFAIDDISFAPVQQTASGGDSILVIHYDKPVVDLGNDTTICVDSTVTFNAVTGSLWDWSNGDNTSSTTANTTGAYSIVITDGNGCKGYDTINLVMQDLPIIDLGNDIIICIDSTITFDAAIGTVWNWSNGDNTQTTTVNLVGDYSVIAADAIGCTGYDTINLKLQDLPIINLGNDTTICADSIVSFNAAIGTAWTWSNGDNTQTTTVNSTGTYSVIVADAIGCTGYDTINLVMQDLPIINLGNDTTICADSTIMFNAVIGVAWDWNNGDNTITTTVNSTGAYSVIVTDAIGCTGYDTINLVMQDLPLLNLGNDTTICADSTIMFNTAIGVVWDWNNGDNTQTSTVNSTGAYSVIVADAIGCTGYDTINLVMQDLPIIDLGNDTTICADSTITFDAQIGVIWDWNNGDNTQTTTVVNTAGIYSVIVADAIGCTGYDTINLVMQAIPVVDLGNDTVICEHQSVVLDAKNIGQNFLWNSGNTSQTIVVETEGLYSVEVMDDIGCFGADEIYVTKEFIEDPYLEKDHLICEGTSMILVPDLPKLYKINWALDLNNSSLEVSKTGAYSSYVESEYCRDTFIVNVTKIDTPDAYIVDLRGEENYCFDTESTTLMISTKDASDEFSWNDFGRSDEVLIEEAGDFNVTVSNAHCSSVFTHKVEDYCEGKFFIPNAFTPGDGNGLNEVFMPISNGHVDGYDFRIYNRWGVLIFKTNIQGEGWDGNVNNRLVQVDVYIYRIGYNYISESGGIEREEQVGKVTLLR